MNQHSRRFEFSENPRAGLQFLGISKTYQRAKALDDLDLSIKAGEFVGLIGSSGSGKSTLLRLCNGLVASDPEVGSFIKVGEDYIQQEGQISSQAREIRSRIGFVFQGFNLVGRLSLLQNVLIGACSTASTLSNLLMWHHPRVLSRAMAALDSVGLADLAGQRADTLSGGQQQRAAIARAIMQRAEIILADEPIASLDPDSSRKIMNLLRDLNLKQNITILISLHQVEIARNYCRRIIALNSGRIQYDCPADTFSDIDAISLYESQTQFA